MDENYLSLNESGNLVIKDKISRNIRPHNKQIRLIHSQKTNIIKNSFKEKKNYITLSSVLMNASSFQSETINSARNKTNETNSFLDFRKQSVLIKDPKNKNTSIMKIRDKLTDHNSTINLSVKNKSFRFYTELKEKFDDKKVKDIYRNGIKNYIPEMTKEVNNSQNKINLKKDISSEQVRFKKNHFFKKLEIISKKNKLSNIKILKSEINSHYSLGFQIVNPKDFKEKYRNYGEGVVKKLNNKLEFSKGKLAYEMESFIKKINEEKKIDHLKRFLKKIKKIIITAALHFKRLNISLEEFYNNKHITFLPYEKTGSKIFFKHIKEGNFNEVQGMVQRNKFLVFDFDHMYQTPLHWAVKRDHISIIQLLLKSGAITDSKDCIGNTPLHYAAKLGSNKSVKILIRELANPAIKNNEGKMPLDMTDNQGIKEYFKISKAIFYLNNNVANRRVHNGINFVFRTKKLDKLFLK